MRTSEELYHQVRWDPRFDPARFTLGLLQRGAPPKRVPLPSFVPGGDVPWHRVLFVEADGELVWDRATGIDLIGSTPAGQVRDPRLLRAPFFTARTPYAWDPAGDGAWLPAPEDGPRGAGPARVRLLTWNTLWDRYDAPHISTARRRPLLLADLAAADADVIALQEVERELLAMLLAEPWVRAEYTVAADPRGRDVAESGLLVLSRLPVREAGAHALGPHKAVVAVTVDTAGGPLVVAATHLTSDHTENGAARRAVELTRISEGLAGVEAGAIAVLGDFNDGRSGTEGPAAALGLRDAWNEVHGAADQTPTFDPVANPLAAVGSLTGRASRLDRILLRSSGVRVTQAALRGNSPAPDGLFISDHYGVEATMEFGPADGAGGELLDARPTARTAVAWLPPHDAAVEAVRREHDPQAGRWPAHVNVLFGFVPESSFEAALPILSEVAARTAEFTARLEGVYRFGPTLWLDPAAAGDAPWQELRRALEERFPGCRGRSEGYTPHLTLGRSQDPGRAEAELTARLGGGRSARVDTLAVLSRRGDGPMQVRATVRLGTGEVRWAAEPATGGARQKTEPTRPIADPEGLGADPRALDGEPAPTGCAARVTARIAAALPEAAVHVVGSRRMGCALPDADLDLVACLPGTADIAEVRARLAAAFPEADRLREVRGARVPGLRLRVTERGPASTGAPEPGSAGAAAAASVVTTLDVDLVLVATGSMPPEEAVARRAELGPAAAVALSAVSDADAVRAFVGPEHAAFARLAREVKAWARSRGLDSAPFGGLPGLAWTVLAAHTVRTFPGLAPGQLLQEFFATWAAWDWRMAVALPGEGPGDGLLGGPGDGPGVGVSDGGVTVLTPSAPVRSCTTQVGPGTRDLLGRELYTAWEALEGGAADGFAATPPPLHRRHAAWAVVTVTGERPGEFEENLGRMRGRVLALLDALSGAGCGEAHAWPRPFERTRTLARYAIGLGSTPPDATALAAVTPLWSARLPGTEVARVDGGAVPDLP
ncbi:poly(A) polymerase [Streptomyces sp. NBC_00503]|uniref:poly(A) polymerase n=1 Tax=Streptomyces sp. NBC_00503 TaxID=2903659 RepID=UPI002E803193|nr:poly(A) polymerase [Streptomyces sp. NBC_00503]WUD79801.1 RNA repair domain-containing protein [Streptomyces sp. NBC_00503]